MARKEFVTSEYGESAWTGILEALSEADRHELQSAVISSTWHAFELNDHLDRAIVDELGEGSREIFERIGRTSAQKNLSGPHRAFVADGDPAFFLEGTDRIYGFYYDTGRRTYEATGPHSGVITTYDAETFSETDCLTVVGWYKEALKMCGATDVEMTEESCRARGDSFCRYNVSWK